jgi:hypothetical protein
MNTAICATAEHCRHLFIARAAAKIISRFETASGALVSLACLPIQASIIKGTFLSVLVLLMSTTSSGSQHRFEVRACAETIKSALALQIAVPEIPNRTASAVAAMLNIWALDLANELSAPAVTRQIKDPNYKVSIRAPSLSFDPKLVSDPRFSDQLNQLAKQALDAHLQLDATLGAISLTLIRYYSALESDDKKWSQKYLSEVRSLFRTLNKMEKETADRLERLANEIKKDGADVRIDQNAVRSFQANVLAGKLPVQETELLQSQVARISPILGEIIDPVEKSKRWLLGVPIDKLPTSYSELLREEALAIRQLSDVIGLFPGIHFAPLPTPRETMIEFYSNFPNLY